MRSGNGSCNDGTCTCQLEFGRVDWPVDICEHLGRCIGHGHGRCTLRILNDFATPVLMDRNMT